MYKGVIELESKNMIALKRLANIYGVQDVDYKKAIGYYEKIVSIDPNDTGTLHLLGWAYYNEKNMDNAIRIFQEYLDLEPSSPAGYYGIAQCYSSYTLQDKDNARRYYQLAIDNGLSGISLDYARDYLNK